MDKSKWEYKKLGEVAKFVGGGTPSKANEDYYTGNIPWATVRDMVNFNLSKTELCITDQAVKESATNIIPKDTIIISTHVGLGKICLLMQDTAINQDLKGVILPQSVDKMFFAAWYKSIADYVISNGKGATVKGVTMKFVNDLKIPIPPINDQQRIVAELDCLNEMIALKQEQLKEFDKLAQSIFYDMFGDPITNEKGWKMSLLKDATTNITDGDHMPPPKSERGVPFVTISNVNKETHQIDFSNTYFVPKEYYDAIPDSKKPQGGDVLYTVTGSYGIPILLKEKKEFCFQRHIGLIRPGSEIEPVFLCIWAECKPVKEYADRVATGVAQKTVSLKALRSFPIILPPLALQQQFAEKIQAIEAQKELVKQSIAETQQLLDSRMDYYFD